MEGGCNQRDCRSQLGQWVRESIEVELDLPGPTTTRSSKRIGILRLQDQVLGSTARELDLFAAIAGILAWSSTQLLAEPEGRRDKDAPTP